MNEVLWMLVAFGITTTITIASITKPLRVWLAKKSSFLGKLVHCSMCTGFWVGMLLSLTYFSPTGNLVFDGFLSSASSWLLFCLTWFFALRYGQV